MYEIPKSFLVHFLNVWFESSSLIFHVNQFPKLFVRSADVWYEWSKKKCQCKWWFTYTQQLHLICNNIYLKTSLLVFSFHNLCLQNKNVMRFFFHCMIQQVPVADLWVVLTDTPSEKRKLPMQNVNLEKKEYIFILFLLITKVWSK